MNHIFISKSTMDKRVLIKTFVVSVLPSVIVGGIGIAFHLSILIIICLIFLMVLIMGYVYTPYNYLLTMDYLIIKRHLKDINIPIQSIKDIRLFIKEDRKGIFRLWGVEGAFGNFGIYRTNKHKYLDVYTRRDNNWTLIITPNKKYIIAPDDIKLIDAIRDQMDKLNQSYISQKEEQESISTNFNRKLPKIITFIILAGTTILLYLGYREPKTTISPVSFKVQYPWGMTVPITEIASVDTVSWKDMPPITLRTNGISLFGVNRGSFKTKEGDKIRLSVKCNVSPVIRIVDRDSKTYYVNRKNPKETRDIFISLTTHLNTEKE